MTWGTMRTAAILAAALGMGACAKITAPSMDFAGPTPSFDARATAVDAFFSHFTGALTVSALSVQHAGPAAPATSTAAAGSSAGVTTVRLSAAPTFSVGDVVSLTWSGNAKTLLGASYVITQSATYHIRTASLVVQTPWGGLGPGASGKVCVALQPNAPSAVNVTLDSAVVAVTPATLHIAAGQPKADAAASATIGGFSCPLPSGGGAVGVAQPPRCDRSNGVVATATLGGVAIHGCGNTGPGCCGVNGQTCAGPAPPPSLCP